MSTDQFINRHTGPCKHEIQQMLDAVGIASLDELIEKTIPQPVLSKKKLDLPPAMSETEYLNHLRVAGKQNALFRSFIGLGYYGTAPLSVVVRNILENPSWYTSYTPYQAEISQGRLEALLNFQTMITSLTGMDIANASMLDEACAAAEAMIMMFNTRTREAVKAGSGRFFVDDDIFPQTLDVLKTRSAPLGIELILGNYESVQLDRSFFGAFVQYPAASGQIRDYRQFIDGAHELGVQVCVAADLLSLALLTPPGEWGADAVVGSNQRMGLPMSFGGPHAGFFATREALKRSMPGRIIGVSVDAQGNTALRMALQTREQHIKRERATSNICTAQALLAIMSGMYAQYHGPEGLKRIAHHINRSAHTLNAVLHKLGYAQLNTVFFDTLKIKLPDGITAAQVGRFAGEAMMNFHYPGDNTVSISLDEITTVKEINIIAGIFARVAGKTHDEISVMHSCGITDGRFLRKSPFLQEKTFNRYHSETEMMRYIKMLERRDISLTHSMIPLGSCTMKLNSATSMFAMSWPEFADIHPFAPAEQAAGYAQIMGELGEALKEITGFSAISFQPNSGAAGEYAGLITVREYHIAKGERQRNVALIPASAHGTNPASAAMAGMKTVVVDCDVNGNISLADMKAKLEAYRDTIACIMITYPSTHGVFEEEVIEIIRFVHDCGGLVYMDGANMNAQTGLTSPGTIGADICHLNLHKTFAIPHGGGGPGAGPILCNDRLAPFLPSHPAVQTGGSRGVTAVSAAPYGSAHVLAISHAYIMMTGAEGLATATRLAILNANYISARLKGMFRTLYTGAEGFVAHEMILDCRQFKAEAGITESDIAKRLMDYGFHAPTLSFPVHGTLMVEPTESESLRELDRFVNAMKSIWNEIQEIRNGTADRNDNPLKNAPHTMQTVTADRWNHKYTRQQAAFPLEWIAENKFWPSAGRIDDAYGDRNLVCTCAAIEHA
jgi:glycine dehydrogenase